jgi:hypothetical protein
MRIQELASLNAIHGHLERGFLPRVATAAHLINKRSPVASDAVNSGRSKEQVMKSPRVISDPDIGDPLDVFLEDFPSVSRELAVGMEYQQNLATLPVAILVVLASSNRIEDLALAVPAILGALAQLPPRTLRKVAA